MLTLLNIETDALELLILVFINCADSADEIKYTDTNIDFQNTTFGLYYGINGEFFFCTIGTSRNRQSSAIEVGGRA